MQPLLDRLVAEAHSRTTEGKVANYIPELLRWPQDGVGIAIHTLGGEHYYAGQAETRFTIQSISKVITLLFALENLGKDVVFSRIGVEQTSDAFNSIIKLETTGSGKPLNPLINAGAIATVSTIVESRGSEAFNDLLIFARRVIGNPDLDYDDAVYQSEWHTGDINRALAYFQKGKGNILAPVDLVLETYFKMCSILSNCNELSALGALLAQNGKRSDQEPPLFSTENARITKAIMSTCGLYDYSGRFAVKVGLPGKSGVGGGILCTVPGKMGIATFGPALDHYGNSIAGIHMLEKLSKELDLSIYS